MGFDVWLSFVAASILLSIIPGPTVLIVLSYAITQGRRVALATVAGVGLGDLIAMTASLAGIGVLILTSAFLFTILKWIGAAYLIFLGVKLIRNAPEVSLDGVEDVSRKTAFGVFSHVSAVTALNPKSIMFFIAFVPQFIDPSGPLFSQSAILIATFVVVGLLNALVYALLADQLRSRISKSSVMAWFARLGGGALVVMGVATLFVKRSA